MMNFDFANEYAEVCRDALKQQFVMGRFSHLSFNKFKKSSKVDLENHILSVLESWHGIEKEYIFLTGSYEQAASLAFKTINFNNQTDPLLAINVGPSNSVRNYNVAFHSGLSITSSRAQKTINLIASPDIEGKTLENFSFEDNIWDASLHNPIYTNPASCSLLPIPLSKLMVGSLDLYLGLENLGLGYIATDDETLFGAVKYLATGLNYKPSAPSLEIAREALFSMNKESFERTAYNYLNDNKIELSKLDHIFSDPLPNYGNYWFTRADRTATKLLFSAGISYLPCHFIKSENKEYIAISLGRNRELTSEVVKMIRKIDER